MSSQVCLLIFATLIAISSVIVYRKAPDPEKGLLYYYVTKRNESFIPIESFTDLPQNFSGVTVILHGYSEHTGAKWMKSLVTAHLHKEPKSAVLLVDYWHYNTICRPYMSQNIINIAQELASNFISLVSKGRLNLNEVNIICFSMGCRVAGAIKPFLKTNQTFKRITGIDPSMPWAGYANSSNPNHYLDDSDADEVVAIKTSKISTEVIVSKEFIFNDGLQQPGCYEKWYQFQMFINICSHYRALDLVTEALRNSKAFPSCPVNTEDGDGNCLVKIHFMDTDIPKGKYKLQTNSIPPFSEQLRER